MIRHSYSLIKQISEHFEINEIYAGMNHILKKS
jgi:hypothetical protein